MVYIPLMVRKLTVKEVTRRVTTQKGHREFVFHVFLLVFRRRLYREVRNLH